MTNCIFCNKLIAKNKYCSKDCIKKMWYKRKNPRSYSNANPVFWKSNTGIGFKWEQYAAKLLKAKHLEFNKFGADLDWDGKSVDVKVCNPWKKKKHLASVWVFNRGKNKPIDFFFCIVLEKGKPIKKLLIPSDKFPRIGIVIGRRSKYDEFIFE